MQAFMLAVQKRLIGGGSEGELKATAKRIFESYPPQQLFHMAMTVMPTVVPHLLTGMGMDPMGPSMMGCMGGGMDFGPFDPLQALHRFHAHPHDHYEHHEHWGSKGWGKGGWGKGKCGWGKGKGKGKGKHGKGKHGKKGKGKGKGRGCGNRCAHVHHAPDDDAVLQQAILASLGQHD
jgi:hypothetical protein